MCGNREDAEDIVQKAFIQAYNNIGSFKGESSVYTWLYTIAKNLCLKHLQEKKKGSFSDIEQLIQIAKSNAAPDCYSALEKNYYISQVKEGCLLGLLRCLSFYQRMAFILNVLLEMKAKDISLVINKSETATRLLIHRAKLNLKDFLCKNCSLYDTSNPCRCENLINFSLKQGWIEQYGRRSVASAANITAEIENEIDCLRKVLLIYSSMQNDGLYENRLESLQEKMRTASYKIFSTKKVK